MSGRARAEKKTRLKFLAYNKLVAVEDLADNSMFP